MNKIFGVIALFIIGTFASSYATAAVSMDEVAMLEQEVIAARALNAQGMQGQGPSFLSARDAGRGVLREGWKAQSLLSEAMRKTTKIEGELRLSMGVYSDGSVEFSRADQNLNERDWRLLSDNQLNYKENSFDPAIYSRLKVVLDSAVSSAVSMHLNVTVDPWSYTAKSKVQTVTGSWGNDTADVQYLFWGNTGFTLAGKVRTRQLGDAVAIPQIKVKNDRVPETRATSTWGDTFVVPETRLDYTFNPLRELWFDIKPGDKGTIRIFPMAYQDQALNSDDPLKLSNNRSYWEESPWLRDWTPGNFNADAAPATFTKGKWDRTIANYSRDSDGLNLTALRGVSLDMKPNEGGTLKAVVAAPKTLWQEYSEVTAVPGSLRWKQFIGERLFVGTTGNMHLGLVNNNKIDAENYVRSVDTGFLILDGLEVNAQASSSNSVYDKTTPAYETHHRGNAYYMSVELNSTPDDPLNHDYFGERAPKGAQTFAKTRAYFGLMEPGFESSLSNYIETRDDAYWSRHLTFYPSTYRNLPGTDPVKSEFDLEPFAIGDGLDRDRKVVGWRSDLEFFEGRLKGLNDIRHVTNADDEFIETVARTQWVFLATDKLTTKAIALRQHLPKTTSGDDSFMVDNEGNPLKNTAVTDGEDPTLNTGSVGARYQVTDRVAVNGVWERTNDFTNASDNFPRSVYNSTYLTSYLDDGRRYSKEQAQLYGQGYFDQAPYDYHNIMKGGIQLNPTDAWTLYLDYTRNPNKFAGNIDDNSNHFGIESSYVPNDRFGLFARYTFTRWYSIYRLNKDNDLDYHRYNNFFVEGRYFDTKDSNVALQYGVGPGYTTGVSATSPAMAYYAAPVLDTQHVIRLIYRRKF